MILATVMFDLRETTWTAQSFRNYGTISVHVLRLGYCSRFCRVWCVEYTATL